MPLQSKSLTSVFAKTATAGMAFVAPFIIPSAAMAQGTMSSLMSGSALNLGPVTFTAPMMLAGLASLPVLWWLMRSVPPKPVIHAFPAIKLLFNLKSEDQEPARMPVWQRLIRLTMAAAVITGLAQPVLNPSEPIKGDGTLLLVVDNGWAAAHNWEARVNEMQILVERARRDNRPVMIMPTAPRIGETNIQILGPMSADEAATAVNTIEPTSWQADHQSAADAVRQLTTEGNISTHWLGNGLHLKGSDDLGRTLLQRGPVTVTTDTETRTPVLLSRDTNDRDNLSVTLRRLPDQGDKTYILTATDISGRAVYQTNATMQNGETEISVTFDIAPEIRSQLLSINILGENNAGGTLLLDEQWHNRPVGIISGSGQNGAIDDTTYIRHALSPYADVTQGTLSALLESDLSVLVMTDSAQTSAEDRRRIAAWVDNGGTLLRFAGPRLALENNDDLLPVPLRAGERSTTGLGSSATGTIAPFSATSPFNNIHIPEGITIRRSVLAEPSPDLDSKTWARLDDGTPLVTADQRGQGRIILVHTSADTSWSNIPLTGLFIEMAKTTIAQSRGVAGGAVSTGNDLPPSQILNGQGYLTDAPQNVGSLSTADATNGTVNAVTPPGFYGYTNVKYAHNLSAGVTSLTPHRPVDGAIENTVYTVDRAQNDLKGPLLAAGFGILIADLMILLGQQGHLPAIRRRKNAPAKTV